MVYNKKCNREILLKEVDSDDSVPRYASALLQKKKGTNKIPRPNNPVHRRGRANSTCMWLTHPSTTREDASECVRT